MEKRTVDAADALALVERDESHFWDHKSFKSGGAVIQKIAAALANSDGGEFIVGVEDRSKGVGLDRWIGFNTIEDATPVLDAIARDVEPPVPYAIEFLAIHGREEAGMACLVQVQKSENLHYTADKKVYIRRGASTVVIQGQAIVDLNLSKGARSYEDQLLADYDADDLVEEDELKYFLTSYSPSTSPSDFVRKQRLIDRQSGAARVAAAILYAASPPAVMPKRCAVKVARYNTKDELPKREHLNGTPVSIEGPARLVIDETLRYVTELFESVSVLKPDGTMGKVNYPPEALKEIVVNAVVHRDYNISDDILVSVFNNRVEVRSPGRLPGHMTLDNLLRERFARNPSVVRLLNKYPDPPNKDIGEGLRTVLDKMAEAKLQAPKFVLDGGSFVVRLGHTPLARPQEIVLEYLESHDEITNAVGRGLTGITSENAMKDVFYSLRDAGQIDRVPGKRGNKSAWQLIISAEDIDEVTSPDLDINQPEVVDTPVDTIDVRAHVVAPIGHGRAGRNRRRYNLRPDRAPARNWPCPCGSGLKFKRCHGQPGTS